MGGSSRHPSSPWDQESGRGARVPSGLWVLESGPTCFAFLLPGMYPSPRRNPAGCTLPSPTAPLRSLSASSLFIVNKPGSSVTQVGIQGWQQPPPPPKPQVCKCAAPCGPHSDKCVHTQQLTQRSGAVQGEPLQAPQLCQRCHCNDKGHLPCFAAHQCPHRVHPRGQPQPRLNSPHPQGRQGSPRALHLQLSPIPSFPPQGPRGFSLGGGAWVGTKPRAAALLS